MKYMLLLLALAGCVHENGQVLLDLKPRHTPTNEEIEAAIEGQCNKLGVTKGSPNYYNCYTHYENILIQAMLASASGRGASLPPVTAFAAPPTLQTSPINPAITCEHGGRKTICY